VQRRDCHRVVRPVGCRHGRGTRPLPGFAWIEAQSLGGTAAGDGSGLVEGELGSSRRQEEPERRAATG
jgi:hypothetical protein